VDNNYLDLGMNKSGSVHTLFREGLSPSSIFFGSLKLDSSVEYTSSTQHSLDEKILLQPRHRPRPGPSLWNLTSLASMFSPRTILRSFGLAHLLYVLSKIPD
jgi:hypothetical protein